MRIGLFGGSFDPVHCGHLAAVEAVSKGLQLDRCHLIPTAIPPHKNPVALAPAEQRLRMIEMATAGRPCLVVSTLEIERSGPSYTIDTVKDFTASQEAEDDLILAMGFDAFMEIDTWKSYRRLFDLVQVAVLFRRDADNPVVAEQVQAVERQLRAAVADGYAAAGGGRFVHRRLKAVHFVAFDSPRVSSTAIRARCRRGKSLDGLVPGAVAAHIQQKGLYR